MIFSAEAANTDLCLDSTWAKYFLKLSEKLQQQCWEQLPSVFEELLAAVPHVFRCRVVVVDGNIGVGKTTCIQNFCANTSCTLIEEPVHFWETAYKTGDALKYYYEIITKKQKHPFVTLFEIFVLFSRIMFMLRSIEQSREDPRALFLCERSFLSDRFFKPFFFFLFFYFLYSFLFLRRIFYENNKYMATVEEQACYDKCIDLCVHELYEKNKANIYFCRLQIPSSSTDDEEIEECLKRIAVRNRPGEDLIKSDYLQQLNKLEKQLYANQLFSFQTLTFEQFAHMVVETTTKKNDESSPPSSSETKLTVLA